MAIVGTLVSSDCSYSVLSMFFGGPCEGAAILKASKRGKLPPSLRWDVSANEANSKPDLCFYACTVKERDARKAFSTFPAPSLVNRVRLVSRATACALPPHYIIEVSRRWHVLDMHHGLAVHPSTNRCTEGFFSSSVHDD